MIEVPDQPRRLAERAIDAAANLMSVATGHGRSITSPNLPVAFYAESDDERAWLRGLAGVKNIERGVGVGHISVFTTRAELARLNDREDGTSLLAEAMSQDQMGGRFSDLLRVFERAFAESADRLVPMLADFLASRPRLGYAKTEVKHWIIRLRGRAIHADRHAPLFGADLENYVDRIVLAAYEVLFNKANWHSYDSCRREVWTLITGPLDAAGNWFYVQHRTEAPHLGQLYDPHGVYPLKLGASGLRPQ